MQLPTINKTLFIAVSIALCPISLIAQSKKAPTKKTQDAKMALPALIVVVDIAKDGKPLNPKVKESTLPTEERERIEPIALKSINNLIRLSRSAAGSQRLMKFVRIVGTLEPYITMPGFKVGWAMKSGTKTYELAFHSDVTIPVENLKVGMKIQETGEEAYVFDSPTGEYEVIGLFTEKSITPVEVNKLKAATTNTNPPPLILRKGQGPTPRSAQ